MVKKFGFGDNFFSSDWLSLDCPTYKSVAPISWAKVALKVKNGEQFISFPNKVINFTKKAKFLTPTNI